MKAEKATTELCPPNPNEFDMAAPKEKDIHYQIHHRPFKTMTTRAVVTYQRSPRAASSRLRPCQSPRLVLGSTIRKIVLRIYNKEKLIIRFLLWIMLKLVKDFVY